MAYTPTNVPTDVNQLSDWLRRETAAIAQASVSQVPFTQLQKLNVAPNKLIDGMVVRADGTHWNPGSGSGFYGYRDGAWHLLG